MKKLASDLKADLLEKLEQVVEKQSNSLEQSKEIQTVSDKIEALQAAQDKNMKGLYELFGATPMWARQGFLLTEGESRTMTAKSSCCDVEEDLAVHRRL